MSNRPHHRNPRFPIVRLALACCLAACAGLPTGCESKPTALAPREAVEVTVAMPAERKILDYEEFSGRTAAKESVEIRSRVTGYLDRIEFREGADVKAQDMLFVIDRRPFQADYDKAAAQIAVCQANLKYRQAEVNRNTELVKTGTVTRSEYDQSVAAYEQAVASVTAARATAEAAKVNLDFTEIRSPIDGETSRAEVTKGNLVQADQTLLTTVVSVDPMYVNFDVDERKFLQVQQEVREGKIKVAEHSKIEVQMGLDIEQGFPHLGTIDFADNRVDPSTGTIWLRGVFPNPLPARGVRVLKPGSHARVRLPVGDPHTALLVAEKALGT
ncbi:MAG: efflux RND transporter periplasmic adaptor subunit, partial [Candidatus Aminicenantales bacterium]